MPAITYGGTSCAGPANPPKQLEARAAGGDDLGVSAWYGGLAPTTKIVDVADAGPRTPPPSELVGLAPGRVWAARQAKESGAAGQGVCRRVLRRAHDATARRTSPATARRCAASAPRCRDQPCCAGLPERPHDGWSVARAGRSSPAPRVPMSAPPASARRAGPTVQPGQVRSRGDRD